MNQFTLLAKVYDLIYSNKNYGEETSFVLSEKLAPLPQFLIDLGSGTGGHLAEMANMGIPKILGVEISPQMVEVGKAKLKHVNAVQITQGDMRNFRVNQRADWITSLFHVMCYQINNHDLDRVFLSVSNALKSKGIFTFDFWHGPAVLTDRPKSKTVFFENSEVSVERKTTPKMHEMKNVVEVLFEFTVFDKNKNEKTSFSETHFMRYLFLQEIEWLAVKFGFRLMDSRGWMKNEPLRENDWYGFVCLEKS